MSTSPTAPGTAPAARARRGGARWSWLAPLVVALVALGAWRPMLRIELFGWDTFPTILAARVRNLGELAGTFGEELMGGRFPLGSYYRPLTHLSFALDHALWGLDAFGYRLTDVLLVALGGALTCALALRVVGSSSLFGATLAGLVFALHPVHFEIVPVPPRRAEALAVAFTLAALCAVPRPGERREGLRRALLALACLAAVASKETGVLALVVSALLAAAWAGPGAARRARWAARAAWPAAVAVALLLAVRTWVLGGLGGSAHTTLAGGVSGAPQLVLRYAKLLLYPPAVQRDSAWALVVVALAAVLLPLAFALLVRGEERRGRGEGLALRDAARWLAAWLVALMLVIGTSGLNRAWYALPFLPLTAIALGLLAARSLEATWRGRARLGAAGVLAALGFAGVPWGSLALSSRPAEVRAASDAACDLLARFERAVREAPDGSTVELDAAPPAGSAVREGDRTSRVVVLPDYALEAYAELRLPDRKVRVVTQGRHPSANAAPAPDEVLVVLVPGELASE